MDNSIFKRMMQYKLILQHPVAIIFFIMIFFYCNWLLIINPVLKIYQKNYLKIQILQAKLQQINIRNASLSTNLEDILKKQFPSLKFTTSNTALNWQIDILMPSSVTALAILDMITSQSYPVIKNFTLKPSSNSNNFELQIIF